MIVITCGPDGTILGAYVLTLVILVLDVSYSLQILQIYGTCFYADYKGWKKLQRHDHLRNNMVRLNFGATTKEELSECLQKMKCQWHGLKYKNAYYGWCCLKFKIGKSWIYFIKIHFFLDNNGAV